MTNGVAALQAEHQFLDGAGALDVQRRAGLVHQDDSRLERQQAGDAELLLLLELQRVALASRRSLRSFQSPTSVSAFSTASSRAGALQVLALAVDAQAEDHVLIDRDGQRVGPLEDHADGLAQFDQRDVRVVDVLAQNPDLARGGDVAVALVDAVEAAQQRGLAAAGRADERGDEAVLDVHGDVDQRLELAVPEVQVAGRDADAGRDDRSSENPVHVFVRPPVAWGGRRRSRRCGPVR